MRGTPRGIAVALLALTMCAALSGAVAGVATQDTVTNTTGSTPTPTPTPTDSSLTDTVENTTDTVENTTDTVENTTDTVENTTDTVENTTDTVENTTDTVENTTDTVENTTDTVDSTVDSTTDTTDSTVDSTTDTVENTTDATDTTLNGSIDGTTDTTLDQITEDTTGALTSSLDDGAENTSDALVDVLDDTLTTTDSLSSLATLDDGSLLEADDDTTFSVSGPASEGTSGTAEFESYEGDDEQVAALEPADSSGVAAMNAGTNRQFPGGPGPMAAGATAVAGLGAVGVGTLLGSRTGVEREVASRVTDALDRLFRMIAPFRYSSYAGSDPLEHEDRKAIHDYVADQPGAYMSAVSEAVGIPHSTARHHVRILEREGLVENAKVRGRRRLFPAHAQQQELAAAMADEATADVLEAIARLGPCSGSALAEEVGKSVSTVSHHLSRLEDDDLVVREKDGRATVNRLPSDVQEALSPEREPAAVDVSAVSAD